PGRRLRERARASSPRRGAGPDPGAPRHRARGSGGRARGLRALYDRAAPRAPRRIPRADVRGGDPPRDARGRDRLRGRVVRPRRDARRGELARRPPGPGGCGPGAVPLPRPCRARPGAGGRGGNDRPRSRPTGARDHARAVGRVVRRGRSAARRRRHRLTRTPPRPFALSAVLESSIFQSFSAVSDSTTGSPVAAPSRAGALLQAAPIVPPRSATAPYANAPARLQALRRVATGFGGVISASVVPPTLLGKTFTWSATTHAYAEDAAYTPAAPGDRVRIILYAVDPSTLKIVETPVTPTGFVDLVDESTTAPAVDKLHVIVSGGTPGGSSNVEYANYTVSAQVTGNP